MVRRDWVVTGGVLSAAAAAVAVYVGATADVMVPGWTQAAAEGYRMVRVMVLPPAPVWLWSAAAVVALWGGASALQTAMGARPAGLVWHADARAFLVYLALFADMWRFFPGPWVRLLPQCPAALIASRALVLIVLTALSMFARKRQFLAIRMQQVRHVPGMRSVTVPALLTVIIAPILVNLAFNRMEMTSAGTETAETVAVSRGIRKRGQWAAGLEFRRNIRPGGAFPLPAGRYRITILDDPPPRLILSSPVMVQPVETSGHVVEIDLPLPTLRLSFDLLDQSDKGSGDVRKKGGTLNISVKPLDASPLPPDWKHIWPQMLHPRFHERPLPPPWKAWLYRLDTNSFDMEHDGFWCKGGAVARWLIVSVYPLQYIQLRLRSIEGGNVVISNGKVKRTWKLKKNEVRAVGWMPEKLPSPPWWQGPAVYCFETYSRRGVRPKDIIPGSADNRFLGVFIGFVTGKTRDAAWIEAAMGDSDALFGKLPAKLERTEAYPWALWLRYRKLLHDGEQSEDRMVEMRYLLKTMLEKRPRSLDPLLNNLPRTLSGGIRHALIYRMKAADILCTCDRLERQRQRLRCDGPECFEAPPEKRPVIFGNAVQMEGLGLAGDGDDLMIRTWWQVKRPVAMNFKIFVHVVPQGEGNLEWLLRVAGERITGNMRHINGDHDFMHGGYPLRAWTPGVVYRDDYRLRIPPEMKGQPCDIRLGLYDPLTGRRLKPDTDRRYILIPGVCL